MKHINITEIIKNKGILHVVKSGFDIMLCKLERHSNCYYHKLFHHNHNFDFQGVKYFYFYHRYNMTWTNERCVEIPICKRIILMYEESKILEVGNVLSNYFETRYDIIDKYDINDKVVNVDVVDFKTTKKYDLIMSISTMEHVGWDENTYGAFLSQKEPQKVIDGINNLRDCLTEKGLLIITIPVGYNSNLDESLKYGLILYTEIACLKRISKHSWVECSWDECNHIKYDFPFIGANALVILFIKKGDGV